MSIQLTYLTSTIALSPDLFWIDEHAWFPVEQSEQRTVTGALIVSTATRVGGRPITLTPEDGSGLLGALTPRATLDVLRTWAAIPGREMTLTLRGVTYSVIFRHQSGPPIDAAPIVHYSDVDGSDWYSVILRFMEI